MKRLALLAATLLAACDATYVTPAPIGAPVGDPCLYRTYHDPACDGSFSWSPGYYDSGHVWIAPRYVRRTVIVPHVIAPAPVIVPRTTVVAPSYRSTVVTPYRPTYRAPVTTTTTVTRSRPLAPRATTTTTTTRRFR